MINENSSKRALIITEEITKDPARMYRISEELLKEALGDNIALDSSNPLLSLLEISAVLTAECTQASYSVLRKQYPNLAINSEELYHHLTDLDYLNVFAKPAKTKINLMFEINELKQHLVYDEKKDLHKIIIPRNTKINVGGVPFMIHYPIEINSLRSGGIQVIYNTDIKSNVFDIESNIVPAEIIRERREDWLKLTLEMTQCEIITLTQPLTEITPGQMSVTVPDQYYYADVFYKDEHDNWVRMYTTHSDQVYDPLTPTALLKYNRSYLDSGSYLDIEIPLIYLTDKIVNRSFKTNLYNTKGAVNMDLGDYQTESFDAVWDSYIEGEVDSIYSLPLQKLSNIKMYSNGLVYGGRDQLTFNQLRERVLQHTTGMIRVPISSTQIETSLIDYGYSLVKDIDLITNRNYLAVKNLPPPVNANLITPPNITMITTSSTINELINKDVVINNGPRVTILPETIYELNNGVTTILSKEDVKRLYKLSLDNLCHEVNTRSFFYSLYHYVLDTTNNEFSIRAYYLSKPEILYKRFIGSNNTLNMSASVSDLNLIFEENQYKIIIRVVGDKSFNDLTKENMFAQLSFIPYGSNENKPVYLNGEARDIIDDDGSVVSVDSSTIPDGYEDIANLPVVEFVFTIDTDLDVDSNDNMLLNGFGLFNGDTLPKPIPLTHDIKIIIGTKIVPDTYYSDDLDKHLGYRLLDYNYYAAVTVESIRIKFGDRLKNLWTRARSIVEPEVYAVYDKSLPLLYKEDVYETDEVGGIVYKLDEKNELVKINKLHSAGDPVKDSDGNIVYQYKKGDLIKDANGNRIITSQRSVSRQFELLVIEGNYYFCTDELTNAYINVATKTVNNWILEELEDINSVVLEQTKVYYYPKATIGDVDVLVKDGREISIPTAQSFVVTLLVSELVYTNNDLIASIKSSTIKMLYEALDSKVVAMSKIISDLRSMYNNDVIDVRIENLGGKENYQGCTILDDARRLGLKKRLLPKPDGNTIIEEDVNFIIQKHQIVKDRIL